MAFTAITASQVDADSPVDSVLMGLIRTNFDDHESRIAASYTPSNTVPQGGLSTALQSGQKIGAGFSTVILTGGSYHFTCGVYGDHANSVGQIFVPTEATDFAVGASTQYILRYSGVGSFAFGFRTRYIQASPPYKLGGVDWNHFMFVLRKSGTGEIVETWEAPDPPWQNNGRVDLPKDDIGRLTAIPHPFVDYHKANPAADGLEVVLLDTRSINLRQWHKDNGKFGRAMSQDAKVFLPGKGRTRTHTDLGMVNIPNFTNKVKIVTP